MDYTHLESLLAKNADKPAIINVNVGTTVKGAVDNLDTILKILTKTGYSEDRFYIHCDGALFGLMVSANDPPSFCKRSFVLHVLRLGSLISVALSES